MYLPRQRLRSRNNIHDHILTVLSCPDRIIQSAHTGGDNYRKAVDGCQTVVPLTKSGQTVQPSDRRDLTAMGMSGQLQVKAQCTVLLQIARLMFQQYQVFVLIYPIYKSCSAYPAGGVRIRPVVPTDKEQLFFNIHRILPQDRDPDSFYFRRQLLCRIVRVLCIGIPVMIAIDVINTLLRRDL